MPIAVITFDFDPLLHLGDRYVRWETLGVAAAILLGIVVAGLLAGRVAALTLPDVEEAEEIDEIAVAPATPSSAPVTSGGAGPVAALAARAAARAGATGATRPPARRAWPGAWGRSLAPANAGHLRRDDMLFIALGIVPGAVIGGRLAYVALHVDYFQANPSTILDPASGGLSLSGAVILGALTGALIARLFETPLGPWFGVAAVPMLLVLGLGKAALILGGTGQGLPSDRPWATRYLGPGPWGSLGPEVPAHPAQAYEAIGVGIVLVVIVVLWRLGAFRFGDGRAFALAVGGWGAVRLEVARFWRDPIVLEPFKAEQLLDLAIVAVAVVGYLIVIRRTARERRVAAEVEAMAIPRWPDPATRKHF